MSRRGTVERARATRLAGLAGALSLLTILPAGRTAGTSPPPRWVGLWFPLVGALVGAAAGAVRAGTDALVGRGAASVLALGLLVSIPGALHADGLADTADGLAARGDAGRRLAVMRDPAIGAAGAIALVLWALLVLAALEPLSLGQGVRALALAAALGRWSSLVHAVLAPAARPGGLGAALAAPLATVAAATAISTGLALLLVGAAAGLPALLAAAIVSLLLAAYARRWLGGRSGDTLGAAVCLAEAAALLAISGAWRA